MAIFALPAAAALLDAALDAALLDAALDALALDAAELALELAEPDEHAANANTLARASASTAVNMPFFMIVAFIYSPSLVT